MCRLEIGSTSLLLLKVMCKMDIILCSPIHRPVGLLQLISVFYSCFSDTTSCIHVDHHWLALIEVEVHRQWSVRSRLPIWSYDSLLPIASWAPYHTCVISWTFRTMHSVYLRCRSIQSHRWSTFSSSHHLSSLRSIIGLLCKETVHMDSASGKLQL